jgi:hypothetical protein
VNATALYRITSGQGLTTDPARAKALSTTRTTVNLLANRRRRPSAAFIAAVIHRFGWEAAAEIFTLEDVA